MFQYRGSRAAATLALPAGIARPMKVVEVVDRIGRRPRLIRPLHAGRALL
jgi:hypothetical protein